MLAATDVLVGGEWTASAVVAEANAERCDAPAWHGLRLFGHGRRGTFQAGVETGDDL